MKTLIAIPCGDQCSTDFLRCLLAMEKAGDVQITFAQGSLVYDARNKLCKTALDGGFDRVLWLDSDMVFNPDLMNRLSAHLDAGLEIVSGLYVTRKKPIKPVVYEDMGIKDGKPYATPIKDYPKDTAFEVEAFGFGAVMMTADLIGRIGKKFGLPFSPVLGFGEDLSFCARAKDVGARLVCDPTIQLGHVGVYCYTVKDLES